MTVKFTEITNPTTIFQRSGELVPRPRKLLGHHNGMKFAEFELRAVSVSLHPDLPPTPVWAYDGLVPGPTVVVEAGDHVHMQVENRIGTNLPYEHVVVDDNTPDTGTMNTAGADYPSTDAADNLERDSAHDLTANCVMHLHGAPTPPDSDGWAESVITHSETAHHHYQFRRETFETLADGQHPDFVRRSGAGPMFWYHDHAMGATRFNNYAGLAGVWIVRDPVEAMLGLPTDEKYELPLILQDRNLETADGTANGDLTGRLLHKVQANVRECFGPATLVSGKLWPKARVERRVYRLRLLNGSNARYFRLNFFGLNSSDDTLSADKKLADAMIQQIGTDGGLLGEAVNISSDGLLLAPAERADVLIDFGLVSDAGYNHVVVFNNASAPYGKDEPSANPPWVPDTDPDFHNDNHRPVPQVMRFDLEDGKVVSGLSGKPIKSMKLDAEFTPLPTDHDELPPHGHSLVVLREEDEVIRDKHGNPVDKDGKQVSYDDPNVATRTMLFLHEMMLQDDAVRAGMDMTQMTDDGGTQQGIKVTLTGASGTETYVTVAKRFTDATTIFIEKGAWHMWKILNLSPDSHPFHVHLTQLQTVNRQTYTPTGGAPIAKAAFEFNLTEPAMSDLIVLQGWKDTFRVNPGERQPINNVEDFVVTAEMLTIFGQFSQRAGRFMYHCHILEHEDADMMRPFVVMPKELMAFMGHGGMAQHASTMAPKLVSQRKL
jgi:spore coat protein A